jgi:hypothetical protein
VGNPCSPLREENDWRDFSLLIDVIEAICDTLVSQNPVPELSYEIAR